MYGNKSLPQKPLKPTICWQLVNQPRKSKQNTKYKTCKRTRTTTATIKNVRKIVEKPKRQSKDKQQTNKNKKTISDTLMPTNRSICQLAAGQQVRNNAAALAQLHGIIATGVDRR